MRTPLLALLLLFAALPLRAEEGVHVLQPKKTLSASARIYGIPMASPISLNGIEDPNKVKIGPPLKIPAGLKAAAATAITTTTPVATATIYTKTTKPAAPLLLAQKSTNPDWRYYGPLQVDWSNWRSMDGDLVAPIINKEGQPGYVGVNCGSKQITVTDAAGAWKPWKFPPQEFEKDLIASICRDFWLISKLEARALQEKLDYSKLASEKRRRIVEEEKASKAIVYANAIAWAYSTQSRINKTKTEKAFLYRGNDANTVFVHRIVIRSMNSGITFGGSRVVDANIITQGYESQATEKRYRIFCNEGGNSKLENGSLTGGNRFITGEMGRWICGRYGIYHPGP